MSSNLFYYENYFITEKGRDKITSKNLYGGRTQITQKTINKRTREVKKDRYFTLRSEN